MAHKDKKFCLLCAISQEPYIIWSSFLVHICKLISPGIFFTFSKFDFWSCCLGKRAKNGPRWQKNLSCSITQELYIIWLSFTVHICKMIISPSLFSLFQNIDFPCCQREKGKKMVQSEEKFYPLHFIFQEPYII